MLSQAKAIKAIQEANTVLVVARISEHDMGYLKGNRTDLIAVIRGMASEGTTEFNVFVDEDNDVIVG